jgi:hypothetical protein
MTISLDAVMVALKAMPHDAQTVVHRALARELAPQRPASRAPMERKGRPRVEPYSNPELVDALRRCGRALGRVPTTTAYVNWTRRQCERARRGGHDRPRLPSLASIYKRFKSWEAALAAAALNPDELAAARSHRGTLASAENERVRGPITLLRALDDDRLSAHGLGRLDVDGLEHGGLFEFPLSSALAVAVTLGGSLDWLGGRVVERGNPPSDDASLDVEAVDGLRRGRRLPESAVLEALDVGLGPWRRMRRGASEPTLRQVLSLAGLLGVASDALLRPA